MAPEEATIATHQAGTDRLIGSYTLVHGGLRTTELGRTDSDRSVSALLAAMQLVAVRESWSRQ